jgi:DMSO/TMAO reductase YedYZ molybdopterin-dependent catalytic subunit
METRRKFIKKTVGLVSGIAFFFSPFFGVVRSIYATTRKIILPKGTKMKSLVHKNPADLDTKNLEIIPLKDFKTMGVTDYEVSLDDWRLEISGHVKTPLALRYEEVLAMPSIERNMLLICPGFFANHGFPLRVVAEGYYGYDWIKYVYKITIDKI